MADLVPAGRMNRGTVAEHGHMNQQQTDQDQATPWPAHSPVLGLDRTAATDAAIVTGFRGRVVATARGVAQLADTLNNAEEHNRIKSMIAPPDNAGTFDHFKTFLERKDLAGGHGKLRWTRETNPLSANASRPPLTQARPLRTLPVILL